MLVFHIILIIIVMVGQVLNYNGGMMMMKALDIILLVRYLAEMEVKDGIMLQIET